MQLSLEHSTAIETGLHHKNEEMEAYLRHVFCVTAAAAAVEDELGQLSRVFQRMMKQVQYREETLKRQVEELKIEIDHAKRTQDVSQITETDYFQQLKRKAKQLREPSGGDAV